MAYTDIDNPELNFQTVLYTGNATARSITLDGSENMQPDWVWCKNRSVNANHHLFDSVRGATKDMSSNLSAGESTDTAKVTSFNTDGFSLGTNGNVNGNTNNQVAWCWKAGGSASSNSDGGITSSVSANANAGFSIVSYTGTGSATTVGHGLGVAPRMFVIKRRDADDSWWTYHTDLGSNDAYLSFHSSAASSTSGGSGLFNSTAPTSSVFSIGTNGGVNASSGTYIAYCFAEKQGYSKFGIYTGNGDSDGPFVYLGFKPAWIMIKRTNDSANWCMYDNKRSSFNVSDDALVADDSVAEYANNSGMAMDFTAQGFKVRGTNSFFNTSGSTYIYMAFAEQPFVNSNGVPNNAR